MGETESIVLEILKQYQKKSGILTEIYRLTEEMSQMLSVNDQVSVQLILEMRQEELDQLARCKETIAYLEEQMEPDERLRFRTIVHDPKGAQFAETWEEKKILEISDHGEQILKKIIDLDRRVNLKVAGKDSFYHQEK